MIYFTLGVNSNDTSKALTCLHDIRGGIHNLKQVSSHIQMNSIVSYFMNQYPNVKIQVEDTIVGEMSMPDMQVYSLLYNLISNACEATCQTDSPFVSLCCKSENHTLYITMKNTVLPTFDMSFIQNKKTNKKDQNNHGIGLSIIHEIVEEHNGIIQYVVQENMLVNEIVLFDVIQ